VLILEVFDIQFNSPTREHTGKKLSLMIFIGDREGDDRDKDLTLDDGELPAP
jgi:hypothetical protein